MSRKLLKFLLAFLIGMILVAPGLAQTIYPDPPTEAPDFDPPEDPYTDENFIKYAFENLGGKFPLDFFGNIPSAPEDCPQIKFFSATMETCWINPIVAFLKYPIWIIFALKQITNL